MFVTGVYQDNYGGAADSTYYHKEFDLTIIAIDQDELADQIEKYNQKIVSIDGLILAKKDNLNHQAKLANILKLEDFVQDEDVVDTWFSSWLWPISVFDGFTTQESFLITTLQVFW